MRRLQWLAAAISGEADANVLQAPTARATGAGGAGAGATPPAAGAGAAAAAGRVPLKDDAALARASVNLEVYSAKLRERLGSIFDAAQLAGDVDKMATLSRLLADFGSSMAERFLSTRPYVLKADAWAFSGDAGWKPPEGSGGGSSGQGRVSADPHDEGAAEREAQREARHFTPWSDTTPARPLSNTFDLRSVIVRWRLAQMGRPALALCRRG